MTEALRHPLDPDQIRSSKAVAVLVLGVAAALTGFFLGGLIPAALALLLARDTEAELRRSAGFLTGWRLLRAGTVLAWVGVLLAATGLVIASIIGLLHLATTPTGTDYAPDVN
jgi:hydroxylaminobenzene mutase